MMANPDIPGTQEEATATVPSSEVDAPAEVTEAPAAATVDVPRPRRESTEAPRRPAPASFYDPEPERMPLMVRVLLGDFAVGVVGLILLFVIEVQRYGDANLALRRRAWGEDLAVLFAVSALFAVITFLLVRARHMRVAIVQAVVTALVLVVAITSATTGDPKPTSADTSTTSGTPGHPG